MQELIISEPTSHSKPAKGPQAKPQPAQKPAKRQLARKAKPVKVEPKETYPLPLLRNFSPASYTEILEYVMKEGKRRDVSNSLPDTLPEYSVYSTFNKTNLRQGRLRADIYYFGPTIYGPDKWVSPRDFGLLSVTIFVPSATNSPALGCELRKDGTIKFSCNSDGVDALWKNISYFKALFAPNSGLVEWLEPQTTEWRNTTRKTEIVTFVKEALAIADSMGLIDAKKLPPFRTAIERGDWAGCFVWGDNKILLNPDQYEIPSGVSERETVFHEAVHYMTARQGHYHNWTDGSVPEHKIHGLEADVESYAAELKDMKKRKEDVKELKMEFEQVSRELKTLRFRAKAMPDWLMEGATSAIDVELLKQKGIDAEPYAGYVKEMRVAKELMDVVGADVFNKSYFSGKFSLIANEYCKNTGSTPAQFYQAFGFEKGRVNFTEPDTAYVRLIKLHEVKAYGPGPDEPMVSGSESK